MYTWHGVDDLTVMKIICILTLLCCAASDADTNHSVVPWSGGITKQPSGQAVRTPPRLPKTTAATISTTGTQPDADNYHSVIPWSGGITKQPNGQVVRTSSRLSKTTAATSSATSSLTGLHPTARTHVHPSVTPYVPSTTGGHPAQVSSLDRIIKTDVKKTLNNGQRGTKKNNSDIYKYGSLDIDEYIRDILEARASIQSKDKVNGQQGLRASVVKGHTVKEERTVCRGVLCKNGGVCVVAPNKRPLCRCPPLYFGIRCSHRMNTQWKDKTLPFSQRTITSRILHNVFKVREGLEKTIKSLRSRRDTSDQEDVNKNYLHDLYKILKRNMHNPNTEEKSLVKQGDKQIVKPAKNGIKKFSWGQPKLLGVEQTRDETVSKYVFEAIKNIDQSLKQLNTLSSSFNKEIEETLKAHPADGPRDNPTRVAESFQDMIPGSTGSSLIYNKGNQNLVSSLNETSKTFDKQEEAAANPPELDSKDLEMEKNGNSILDIMKNSQKTKNTNLRDIIIEDDKDSDIIIHVSKVKKPTVNINDTMKFKDSNDATSVTTLYKVNSPLRVHVVPQADTLSTDDDKTVREDLPVDFSDQRSYLSRNAQVLRRKRSVTIKGDERKSNTKTSSPAKKAKKRKHLINGRNAGWATPKGSRKLSTKQFGVGFYQLDKLDNVEKNLAKAAHDWVTTGKQLGQEWRRWLDNLSQMILQLKKSSKQMGKFGSRNLKDFVPVFLQFRYLLQESAASQSTYFVQRMRQAQHLMQNIENDLHSKTDTANWKQAMKQLIPLLKEMAEFVKNGHIADVNGVLHDLLDLDSILSETQMAERAVLLPLLERVKHLHHPQWAEGIVSLHKDAEGMMAAMMQPEQLNTAHNLKHDTPNIKKETPKKVTKPLASMHKWF